MEPLTLPYRVVQFASIPTSYTKVQVFFKDASETLGFQGLFFLQK